MAFLLDTLLLTFLKNPFKKDAQWEPQIAVKKGADLWNNIMKSADKYLHSRQLSNVEHSATVESNPKKRCSGNESR